jgi:hypothetical protein
MVASTQQKTVDVPKTRADLDVLVSQRNELHSQLRSAAERRAALSEQLTHTPGELRGQLSQRLASLDARITRLEGQLAQLDDAVASGMANPEIAREPGVRVFAEPGHPVIPPIPPIPPMPDGITTFPGFEPPPVLHPRMVIGGALITLSLMALVAWVTWRRAVRRFVGIGGGSLERAEVSRLQQSVDTIALEVERISENQRFVTKLLSGRGVGDTLGADGMDPVPLKHSARGE